VQATAKDVDTAISRAQRAFPDWAATPARERAACLDRAADMLEAERGAVMALCIREAGKTSWMRKPSCARRSISAATTPRAAARISRNPH
jgi:acyl-CoA reductase-like NAD-dependent aldehyde dehydrogenase